MRDVPSIRLHLTVSIALAAGVIFAATAALACGYHNPSDIARGTMNFIYPKSLYVRTAVWQAQNTGLLPARPRRVIKDLFAYQRTTVELQKLGAALGSGPDRQMGFTVVLLDSMLWTRYAAGEEGLDVTVHVPGPGKNEAVLVTEEAVIRALNAGVIAYDVAESRGLIRLYGPKEQQETLRAIMLGQPEDAYSDAPHGAAEVAG